jgi:hypothetical protein
MPQTFNFMNESVDVAGVGTPQEQVVRRYTNSPPVAPTASASAPTTSNPVADYYNNLSRTAPTAEDEAVIRENTRKSMQSQIDAINAQYTTLIANETATQDKLAQNSAGQTRAVSARSGLMGSDFGNAFMQNDAQNSAKSKSAALAVLENEKQVKVQQVLGNIEARVNEELKARKAEALGNQEKYIQFVAQTQEQARNDLKTLAQSGVSLDAMNPAQKAALLKQSGYDEGMGELIFNALKPKPSQIDYQFANLGNGKALFYGTDPSTGQLKQQIIETSNPQADLIIGIITKYPDAGISLEDDLATAQQKIQNSKLYKDQVRPPVSVRGSSGIRTIPTPTNPQELSPQAQAVINGALRLEDLTPTVRGQIAGELNSAGYSPTSSVSAGQRDQLDKLDTLLREANSAQTILETGIDTGPLASRLKAGAAIFGGAQEFTQYRSVIDNLGSILLQARSGAAVTPQEFERIKGFIPSPNDDEKTAKTKVQRFIEEMSAARANYVKRSTQTPAQIKQTSSSGNDGQSLRDKYNY